MRKVKIIHAQLLSENLNFTIIDNDFWHVDKLLFVIYIYINLLNFLKLLKPRNRAKTIIPE